MKTIKGPGIFLAQFLGDEAPFNTLESICKWARSLGYIGVQIPTWDARCIDLKKAAESKTYADEIKGIVQFHRSGNYRTFHSFTGSARGSSSCL